MEISDIKKAANVLNEAAMLLTPEVIKAVLVFDNNDIYNQIDEIVREAEVIVRYQHFGNDKKSELKFTDELFDADFRVNGEDFSDYLENVTFDYKKLLPYAKLSYAYKQFKPAMKVAASYLE